MCLSFSLFFFCKEYASEIKAASDEDSPSEDKSEKLRPGKLMTRFLEGMTNKVSQASKKAQGLMNKAQGRLLFFGRN